MNPVIETLDRTRRYGANRGITDVNLTVGQAEALGFLGPNGVGKTTTIRARLGLLPTEFTLDDRLTGDDLLRLVARLRGGRDLDDARDLAGRLDADLRRPMRRLARGNEQTIGLGRLATPVMAAGIT